MTDQAKVAKVRGLIASADATIMSVTFTKKTTGESRTLAFNPKTAKGILGEKASDSAKQAVASRKQNNPDLINVCDQALLAKGDNPHRCWRSFDANDVTSIKVRGQELLV